MLRASRRRKLVPKRDLPMFYAVTKTSVYKVVGCGEHAAPFLEKIAIRDKESSLGVGEVMNNGTMVSIGNNLNLFVPEGCGITSPNSTVEREIAKVNTIYWGGCTSNIVALFLTKKGALACNKAENLIANDPRWRNETIAVLRAIGTEHMYFSITTCPELLLLPFSEWKPASVGDEPKK